MNIVEVRTRFADNRTRLLNEFHRYYHRASREDVEDAVSGAFANCCQCTTCDRAVEQCYRYLRKSAKRKLHREHKHHVREPYLSPDIPQELIASSGDESRDNKELVEWGFTQLPKRAGNIMRKKFEGFALREVAEELNMKTVSVQTIYTRGGKDFRKIIKREIKRGRTTI